MTIASHKSFASLIAAAATVLCACADSPAESGTGGQGATVAVGGAGGAGASTSNCTAPAHFGVELDFALPDPGAGLAFHGLTRGSIPVGHAWLAIDFDGDGALDLVRTEIDTDPTVGTSRWIVHSGTGLGFGPANDVTLPDDSEGFKISSLNGSRHAVRDMDGDGLPDIIRTWDTDDVSVGNTRWLYYRNTGSGLAEPVNFSLPNLGGDASAYAFDRADGAGSLPDGTSHRWYTLDLDGDDKPDLVRTFVSDSNVGSGRWLFYKNSGTGFEPPADFVLPVVGGANDGFAELRYSSSHNYAAIDLDGDGLLDLVTTYLDGDSDIGLTYWRFYKNTGTGFAYEGNFALPDVGADGAYQVPFDEIDGITPVSMELDHQYATIDLDGDARPDLVRTSLEGDFTLGRDRWEVFKNTGAGFEPTPVDIVLPDVAIDGIPALFPTVDGVNTSNGHRRRWYTVDVDGDGKPEILSTQLEQDPSVGTTRWLVHSGACL